MTNEIKLGMYTCRNRGTAIEILSLNTDTPSQPIGYNYYNFGKKRSSEMEKCTEQGMFSALYNWGYIYQGPTNHFTIWH